MLEQTRTPPFQSEQRGVDHFLLLFVLSLSVVWRHPTGIILVERLPYQSTKRIQIEPSTNTRSQLHTERRDFPLLETTSSMAIRNQQKPLARGKEDGLGHYETFLFFQFAALLMSSINQSIKILSRKKRYKAGICAMVVQVR